MRCVKLVFVSDFFTQKQRKVNAKFAKRLNS